MKKVSRLAFPALVLAAVALRPTAAGGQEPSPFASLWTLNRSLSDLPREIGFNINWMPSSGDVSPSAGGGRSRRGSSGAGGTRGNGVPNSMPRESADDARRLQVITGEARNPPTRLMIVDAPSAVTITNELGQSRTLHPTGRSESIEIQGVSFIVTTTREANQLVTVYQVEEGRSVRYTFSLNSNSQQLVVDVEFLEKGNGDKARRIYERGIATDTASSTAPRPGSPAASPLAGTPSGAQARTSEEFDQRPGAELRGLTSLGILIEDLGSQAIACGLNQDALETALAKRLTAGGLTVKKNSDEDTYVYVNVQTSNLPGGTCVSRYDAFLYTHGTARLSYRDQPVLVQISLIHRGSIGSSSAPGTHAAAVTRGLENYVDLFISEIRNANK